MLAVLLGSGAHDEHNLTLDVARSELCRQLFGAAAGDLLVQLGQLAADRGRSLRVDRR